MTCQLALTLIEDFADGELTPSETEQVRKHLESCSRCREEYQATLQLKKLLRSTPVHDPGPDYWSEIENLIRAKTIDSPTEEKTFSTRTESIAFHRHALVRSLVSVAASLLILVTAIFIGSSQDKRISKLNVSKTPLLATAPVSELLGDENVPVVTLAEQVLLAKGTLLLGPPGFLGRFIGLPDLMATSESDNSHRY